MGSRTVARPSSPFGFGRSSRPGCGTSAGSSPHTPAVQCGPRSLPRYLPIAYLPSSSLGGDGASPPTRWRQGQGALSCHPPCQKGRVPSPALPLVPLIPLSCASDRPACLPLGSHVPSHPLRLHLSGRRPWVLHPWALRPTHRWRSRPLRSRLVCGPSIQHEARRRLEPRSRCVDVCNTAMHVHPWARAGLLASYKASSYTRTEARATHLAEADALRPAVCAH